MKIESVERNTDPKTIYDALYAENIYSWTSKLRPYKDAVKLISDHIETLVEKDGEFYPRPKDVFNALKLTPLCDIKVVIWGQDPYPTLLPNGEPRAQGYAFGVDRSDNVPKSLLNMYKELGTNFDCFEQPNHGDLRFVARQGVLFMNTSLTYCPKDPESHLNIWMRFIHIIITIINENVENCIHVLWGSKAEKLREHIKSREILSASHPSPLSAYRGFFGCRHFVKINITLDRQKKPQINWNEDSDAEPTFVKALK